MARLHRIGVVRPCAKPRRLWLSGQCGGVGAGLPLRNAAANGARWAAVAAFRPNGRAWAGSLRCRVRRVVRMWLRSRSCAARVLPVRCPCGARVPRLWCSCAAHCRSSSTRRMRRSRSDLAAPECAFAEHFRVADAHARAGAGRIGRVALNPRERRAVHFAFEPAAKACYRPGHHGHSHPLGFAQAHRLYLFGSSTTRSARLGRGRRVGIRHGYRHSRSASLENAYCADELPCVNALGKSP